MIAIAQKFGNSLDQDDYKTTLDLLTEDYTYDMGDTVLVGAQKIVDSYEQNMIAGRKKMDKLEWGQSTIDEISSKEFIVNFTDNLFHKGAHYIFQCQQRLFITDDGKINKIEHIHNEAAWQELQSWYKSVGIPTN